jgi:hypothetical protein
VTGLAVPGSHYTKRVVAAAVRSVVEYVPLEGSRPSMVTAANSDG